MMKHVQKQCLLFASDKHKYELLVSTGKSGYYAYSTGEVMHIGVTRLINSKKGQKLWNQGDMKP